MDIPKEFNDFCRGFHQDIGILHPTLDGVIRASLAQFSEDRKLVLKAFLADLLSSSASDLDLEKMWNASPADFFIERPADIRKVFQIVLEQMEKES
jgi:hypothetical protein